MGYEIQIYNKYFFCICFFVVNFILQLVQDYDWDKMKDERVVQFNLK